MRRIIFLKLKYSYFGALVDCLKKGFAILLLCIQLINICGWQICFSLAERAADRQMVASLDENKYNEKELIQIKLPLNIPYTIDKKDFERCDGETVLNGIHYNYVKRMVRNDTMYLYCVPNHQKTELSNIKTEYAKQATDVPAGKKTEQANTKKVTVSDDYSSIALSYDLSVLDNNTKRSICFNNDHILTGFITQPVHPPEVCAA